MIVVFINIKKTATRETDRIDVDCRVEGKQRI